MGRCTLFRNGRINLGRRESAFPLLPCTDRVLITFSETEWGCLKELLEDVLARPGFQPIRDRLSLEYGEI
jgi:hypothetical protein